MKANTKTQHFTFCLFCALSFFSFGTAMMDYFLVYPSRYIISENDFVQYHAFLETAILPISVLPFLVIIVLNIVLLWIRPSLVSKKLITISLVLLLLDFISTVFFQAPWNLQLSAGKNVELMDKITLTNWGRVVLESAQAIVVFMAMYADNKE
jgi:hypothetical protein